MILRDALLAWLHFVLILGLAGCLGAELFIYRRTMERDVLATLRRIDLCYGIFAAAIIASGVARVIYSPKGSAYFMHNPIFWTKMGLFVAVALLSMPPTIHYVRLWREHGAVTIVDGLLFARMRGFLAAEAVVLFFIPLAAALMARGF